MNYPDIPPQKIRRAPWTKNQFLSKFPFLESLPPEDTQKLYDFLNSKIAEYEKATESYKKALWGKYENEFTDAKNSYNELIRSRRYNIKIDEFLASDEVNSCEKKLFSASTNYIDRAYYSGSIHMLNKVKNLLNKERDYKYLETK